MKNILNRLLLLTFAMIPILCLTATAFDALIAAVAVFISLALAVTAKSLCPKIIPENAKNIAILLFIALGISVSEIFMGSLGSEDIAFVPLCAVPTLLLLVQIDCKTQIRKRIVATATVGGLFASLILITGILRELLGQGKIFTLSVTDKLLKPAAIFSIPAGAIFIVALLIAVLQHLAKEEEQHA